MIYIKRAKNKQFYVVVKARNGYVLSTSETLKTKVAAMKNIKALQLAMHGPLEVKDHTI